jgi:hypothetical protein
VISTVESFQTFRGIAQANSIPVFVLLFRTAPAGIPDDNPQSLKVKPTLNRNLSTVNELGNTVPHGVLHQRLQQHAWHQCVQGFGRNRQIDLHRYRSVNAISWESATSGITSLSRLARKSSPICASIRVAAGALSSSTSVETAFRELNKK